MDPLSASARWADSVGQGPAREPCLAAVRAFFCGVEGRIAQLEGVERAFAVEGLGFAARLRGEARPAGWEAPWRSFLEVGAGLAMASGAPGQPAGPEELEGFGFGIGLLRSGAWRVRVDDPAFAHGLGRSLWFSRAGEPTRIGWALRAFPATSRGEIGRGVAFAAAFSSATPYAELTGLSALCASDSALKLGWTQGNSLRALLEYSALGPGIG